MAVVQEQFERRGGVHGARLEEPGSAFDPAENQLGGRLVAQKGLEVLGDSNPPGTTPGRPERGDPRVVLRAASGALVLWRIIFPVA